MSELFRTQAGKTESKYARCSLPSMQRSGIIAAAIAVSTVIVGGISGCQKSTSPMNVATTATNSKTPAPGAGSTTIGSLPNLVGRGLQNAQDAARKAGFFTLISHDALGRGRHQILDRNWKVCFQNPPSGTMQTSSTVDFGAVKLAESCPGSDQAGTEPGPAGASMPNLVGKSAAVAERSLGNNASISFKDATGAGRSVLVASNWRICSQDPAPGRPYGGVPVTLTVAKFTEPC
jgi:hypothetical protein